MLKRIKSLWVLIPCSVVSMFIAILCSNSVSAISRDDMYKLSLLQGIVSCYELGAKDTVNTNANNFPVDKSYLIKYILNLNEKVYVTSGVGNRLTNGGEIKCSDLIEGNDEAKGLKSVINVPTTLDGLGYQPLANNESNISLATFKISNVKLNDPNNAGVDVRSQGAITCQGEKQSGGWVINECSSDLSIQINDHGRGGWSSILDISINENGTVRFSSDYEMENAFFSFANDDVLAIEQIFTMDYIAGDGGLGETIFTSQNLAGKIQALIRSTVYPGNYSAEQIELSGQAQDSSGDEASASLINWKPFGDSKSRAGKIMLYNSGVGDSFTIGKVDGYFSGNGGTYYLAYSWSPSTQYGLYYEYLANMKTKYPGDVYVNSCSTERPNSGYAFKNKIDEWCSINLGSSANRILNTPVSLVDSYGLGMVGGTFADVLNWLGDEESYVLLTEDDYINGVIGSNGELAIEDVKEDDPSNDKHSDRCYGEAGALGWVLCPIIKGISGVGEHMWTQIEENHLQIPVNEIFGNSDGVKAAFDIVRNISNAVFIVLFLFVIFSQLTGFGIDNYGIKKILPKLILVAILANLSYYICEIAIDLSNILGNGLNSTLTSFANNIGYNKDSTGALVGGLAIDGILAGSGVAIFLTLNPAGAVMGAIWIALAVLGIVITIVVAMFVLYLIVVIREAGIVIAVVLAPVAIVCYALPNTEKLYKRWFELLKALLVVYPICGAVVGGGKMAAAALAQVNTTSMAIAAMLVQVLPFFLIPMLLKNSLAGLGNIGAKLSSFGRNVGRKASGGAQRAIKGTERFKDFSKYQQEAAAARRAGRVRASLLRKSNRHDGNLSARDKARLSRANATVVAYEGQKSRNELGADDEYGYTSALQRQEAAFANEREKGYMEQYGRVADRGQLVSLYEEALKGDNAESASALFREIESRGGIKDLLNASMNADWDNMDSKVKSRLTQTMGASHIDAFKAYNKYSGKRGEGARGFGQWYTGANIEADKGKAAVIGSAMSYGSYLNDKGVNSMEGLDKDELEVIMGRFSSVANSQGYDANGNQVPAINSSAMATMLANASMRGKDDKSKRTADEILQRQFANGGIHNVSELGLTANDLGNVSQRMMESVRDGMAQRIMQDAQASGQIMNEEEAKTQAESMMRDQLREQIDKAASDTMTYTKMNNKVSEMLQMNQAVAARQNSGFGRDDAGNGGSTQTGGQSDGDFGGGGVDLREPDYGGQIDGQMDFWNNGADGQIDGQMDYWNNGAQ